MAVQKVSSMILSAGLLFLTWTYSTSAADIRIPPNITRQGPHEHIYVPGTGYDLACRATGYPSPYYEWTKNGEDFHEIVASGADGTLHFTAMDWSHEGDYQCFAKNDHGVAVSVVTRLIEAKFHGDPPPSSPTPYGGSVGDSLTVPCQTVLSVPAAGIEWELDNGDDTKDEIALSPRVTIGENGDLHFAYLMQDDQKESNQIYKCVSFNALLFRTMGLGDAQVRVRVTSDQSSNHAPSLMTATPSTKIMLLNSNDTLKCFFGGKPAPRVSWSREDSEPFSRSRFKHDQYDTLLRIEHVSREDEARYICTGRNSEGSVQHYIDVDVQSKPEFKLGKFPANQNVTEGDTAIFHCDAEAEPEAEIQWLINGQPVDAADPGHRRHIGEGGKMLTIREVCKDCGSDGTDLMVIQCNASNAHGYAFTSGYLNVLKRTVIHTPPTDQECAVDSEMIVFDCGATTDDSTRLTYRWYYSQGNDPNLIYPEYEANMGLNSNYSLVINVTGLDNLQKQKLTGEYICNVSNGFSHALSTAGLSLDEEIQALVGAAFPWWILAVAIALLLLLVIILICCHICYQRGQEDSYPVDEKERAQGHDPEKELVDLGYHDYSRPVPTERVKGSRASLASTARMDSEDDTQSAAAGSMSSYGDFMGDFDPGRFNEDGSFIGEYATEKRKK